MAVGHFNKKGVKKIIFLGIIMLFIFLSWQAFAQKELEIEYPTIPGAETPETVATPIPSFLKYLYNLSTFLVGLLSLVLLIWGGIRYAISANNPGRMADAKEQITAALLGIIIVFASYLILNTINPELLMLRVFPLKTTEITPYSPPEHLESLEYEFQEIPVGTLITSEISPSSFITTNEPDLNWDSEEYDDAFPETTAYSTNYQGALYGRRLKRIHEVASTTLPVVKMLADLSGELADLETKLKNTNGELVIETIKCSCFLHCERPCDFGLTALAGIFQGDVDNVDDFDDISDLFNFDVGNLIEGLDIMDIIWDFVSCIGPCRDDCDCTGDPCPNRNKMNKLREETIPAFYEGEDSPIPCKIAEVEYMSAAFQPFLDNSSQLVKNEEYKNNSFYWTGEAKGLRAKIQTCIDAGSDDWEKAGLAKEDHEKIEEQYEEMEDLIDLMAGVENKGTHFLDTDPPERDVETNIIHLERLLSFLDHSKSMLNPFSQIGCQPQALAFHQQGQFKENYGVTIIPSQFEDVKVIKDPATFYCPKEALPPTSMRNQSHKVVLAQEAETFELPMGQIQTTCSPIIEIPIGKTIDQAIQLIRDILRELGDPGHISRESWDPEGLGKEGIWNMGHLIIDNLLLKQIELSEKTFELSDDLIDLTTEEECGMCDEECQAHCFEIKLPTPVGQVDVAHICYCTGIPCPLVEIILKWAELVFNVEIINKLYDNPGEPIDSVFEAKERIYESFYKFNSEYPDKDPEYPNGHPDAGDRAPIGEDACCNEQSGVCRNEDGSFDDDKMEKRDYTLREKLTEIQKLLNRSRNFAAYQLLIEELIELDLDLASWDEVDEIDNEHRVDLTTCQGLYAQLRERERKEVSRKILENCWTSRRLEHINTELCASDPPYDCDFFDPLFPLKRSSVLCYCFHEDTYPEVANDFFCCSVTQ